MKCYYKWSCYLGLLLAVAFSQQSCNLVNPAEPTPTYIHIDSFVFVQNSSMPYTASSDVKAVWVYYNNSPIGIFDLPATFPVVANGTGQLSVAPGIVVNGRNELMGVYPFYQMDTFSFGAQPGKVITHVCKTGYFTNAKVTVLSNFELGATNFLRVAGNGVMTAVGTDSLRFEGSYSGRVSLNAVGDSSVDSLVKNIIIPITSYAFIEFDYNSTVPFYVGLESHLGAYVSTQQYYLAGIKPNSGWQKFYLNVTDFVSKYQGDDYSFYIKTVQAEGQTSGRLLIDNIQLLTY